MDSDEAKPVIEKEDIGEKPKDDEFKKISTLKLPETVEDFKSLPSGTLTEDFTEEREIVSWPPLNSLEGIEDEFLIQMQKVTEATDDPDLIFKSLIFYLGNNRYSEVIEELMAFEPQFDEPLLPEPEVITSTGDEHKTPAKAIILLDASSSMLLSVDGKQKMGVAKEAVRSFAKTIGASSDISLYVYGHAGTQEDKDKEISCSTIEEIFPTQIYNEEAFFKAVENVEAKGWTPLAEAIKAARENNTNFEGDITLYIVSDGAETCDGNPVEEAKLFAEAKENRIVNIIGFNVDAKGEDQLKQVAAAGKGEYISADSQEELNNSIKKQWVPSFIDVMNKQLSSPKNSFAVVWTNMEINKKAERIKAAVTTENIRFNHAIRFLKSSNVITDEQSEELSTMVADYQTRLKNLSDEAANIKHGEVDTMVNEMDQRIQEWAERMNQLREEA